MSVSFRQAPNKPGTNGMALTLTDLAGAKKLPLDFLRGLGLDDLAGGHGISIPYFDVAGELIATKRRTALKARDGSYWPKGKPLVPYGLWKLDAAHKESTLFLVEGESDCWALWFHGLPALGIPGANTAKCLPHEAIETLQSVYVHCEPDRGGQQFITGVTARLCELGFAGKAFAFSCPEGIKDLADLHARNAEQFKTALQSALLRSAILETWQTAPAPKAEKKSREIVLISLNTIRPRPVRWLAEEVIPLGKLTLIGGDGGHGKSSITLHLAACVTQGRCAFGLHYTPPERADVLLVSCEDDLADTVVPRLLAAGADLARVHRVEGIRGDDGKLLPFSLAYLEQVETALEQRPAIRLIVIDPISAYVGRAGADDYKDSELRSLLDPLAELAARRAVAIVIIKHLRKGETAKAVHRISGSAAYVNLVRSAFIVAPAPAVDGQDDGRKLFLPIKNNLTQERHGLAFRLASLPCEESAELLENYGAHLNDDDRGRLAGQLFRVDWLGRVDDDPDAVLGESTRRGREPNKTEKCCEWLRTFLGNYAWPSTEIVNAAQKAGYSESDVFRAKAKMKDEGLRNSNKRRFGGQWWSGLGDPMDWELRPVGMEGTEATPTAPDLPG